MHAANMDGSINTESSKAHPLATLSVYTVLVRRMVDTHKGVPTTSFLFIPCIFIRQRQRHKVTRLKEQQRIAGMTKWAGRNSNRLTHELQ